MSTTTQPRLSRKLAVKIAQDVLAQLTLNRYKAKNGTYCGVKVSNKDLALDGYAQALEGISLDESFQALFKRDKNVTCEVCAMGSLFTSFVNLENQVTVQEVAEPDFDQMLEKLSGAFTLREILLMEYVFENGQRGFLVQSNCNPTDDGWGDFDYEVFPKKRDAVRLKKPASYRYTVLVDTDDGVEVGKVTFTLGELRRAIAFGNRYENAEDCLRAIMTNVIRNNGKFKLPLRVR